MNSAMPLGYRYDVTPIPPVPEATVYIPAGPVTFGVEYRVLDDATLDANFEGDAREAAIIDEARPAEGLNDSGVSIHVFDTETDAEYLRFDGFDDDPHYHYIFPGSHNVVIPFDQAAHGDFVEWALQCIDDRLVAMLRAADADDLAGRVDQAAVADAVPTVRAAVAKAALTPTSG